MKLSEIKIGDRFRCGRKLYIVTDVGSRVVVAIEDKPDWTAGPPYALAEMVFDEDTQQICELNKGRA